MSLTLTVPAPGRTLSPKLSNPMPVLTSVAGPDSGTSVANSERRAIDSVVICYDNKAVQLNPTGW